MMLGLGINGHIGFFEPAEALPADAFTPAIALVNRERYAADHFGGSLAAVPTHAVTIGLATVMRAKELCLVVVGDRKSERLAEALHGPVTTTMPASLLQLAPCLHVFVDEAAAAKLDTAALGARAGWEVVRHGPREL